jgi:hypothetical protein
MKELSTWGGRSKFRYSGSVTAGTSISYGKGWSVYITAAQYQALLNHFRGEEVEIGTSRDAVPPDSVGEWLQKYVTRTAIASYVGPILVIEGHAEQGSTPSRIRFR